MQQDRDGSSSAVSSPPSADPPVGPGRTVAGRADSLPASGDDHDRLIQSVLRLMRDRFGLEFAFVSHIDAGLRTFRYVDADDTSVIAVGDSSPETESYCKYVVDGSLPQLLRDPAEHPVSAQLSATREIPVGTHLSVPIALGDGNVYGTLCSFGRSVRDDLDDSDIAAMRILASMVSGYIEETEQRRVVDAERRRQLLQLEVDTDLVIQLQPVIEMGTGSIVGYEALSRFPTLESGPAAVFAEARRLGIDRELELQAAAAALSYLPELPGETYLAINLGPATIVSEDCAVLLGEADPRRIVVEITEHAIVDDYTQLQAANRALRDLGIQLAIDDVGTGYSGLDHMLRIQPDVLKLDGALISGIDTDPPKQAIVAALQTYAARIDTRMIAERMETAEEAKALGILGVGFAQGYHYARPAPPAEALGYGPVINAFEHTVTG